MSAINKLKKRPITNSAAEEQNPVVRKHLKELKLPAFQTQVVTTQGLKPVIKKRALTGSLPELLPEALVRFVDNEPRVTSKVVAEKLGIQHDNLFALISKNLEHLEEFGLIPFQTGSHSDGILRGKPPKFYLLNENQSYLILTLVRTTAKSIEFKKALIHAFAALKGDVRCLISKLDKQYSVLADQPLDFAGFKQLSFNERKAQRKQISSFWRRVGFAGGEFKSDRINITGDINWIINGIPTYKLREILGINTYVLIRDYLPLENQYAFYLAEFDLMKAARRRNYEISMKEIQDLYIRYARVARERIEIDDLSGRTNLHENLRVHLEQMGMFVEVNAEGVTPYSKLEDQLEQLEHERSVLIAQGKDINLKEVKVPYLLN